MKRPFDFTRRGFMASAAAGAATMSTFGKAFAQSFPDRNINVTINTGEGGGGERDARAFSQAWSPMLNNANFEYNFYPGASGQVGYEHYLQRVEPNPHNIMSAYIGPEMIMITLQAPHIKPGEDFVYFQQYVQEPMSVFVGADSPIESIEQLVETAQQRTVTVAKSRLPHPASISMLALGEATDADFNLVPFGGGGPSGMAAITGETDCCALPLSNPITLGDQVRILGVFMNENPVKEQTNNAPTVNGALGLDIPVLTAARAWAIHRETVEKYPEEFELLRSTAAECAASEAFAEARLATGAPVEFIAPGGEEEAMEAARVTAELAERYRDLLTGDS